MNELGTTATVADEPVTASAPAASDIDESTRAVNAELEAVADIINADATDVRKFTTERVNGVLAAKVRRIELRRQLLELQERYGREVLPGLCEAADAAWKDEHDEAAKCVDAPGRIADELRAEFRKQGFNYLLTDGPGMNPIIEQNERWRSACIAVEDYKRDRRTGLYSGAPSAGMKQSQREAVEQIEAELKNALADAGVLSLTK